MGLLTRVLAALSTDLTGLVKLFIIEKYINAIWHGGIFGPPVSYTVIKNFLIGLASWALCYSNKIYFYTF